jgi:hypothetical protein
MDCLVGPSQPGISITLEIFVWTREILELELHAKIMIVMEQLRPQTAPYTRRTWAIAAAILVFLPE